MGWFDKLLGRDTNWYIKKSLSFVESGDLREAMLYAHEACEKAETGSESEKEEASAAKAKVHRAIYEQALEKIQESLRAKQQSATDNAIERAQRHAQTDEERQAIQDLIQRAQAEADVLLPSEGELFQEEAGREPAEAMDFKDKWSIYVTTLPFARAQRFDELGDKFKAAWILLQEGNFDEAIEQLEAIYEEKSDDVDVIVELGRAHFGKGNVERAAQLLEQADKAGALIEAKLLRAQIAWAQRRFDLAETVLQEAHDLEPENPSVLAVIAQHGLISGDFESGIAAIEVLLEIAPNDVSVLHLAGRLYLENREPEKALNAFEGINQLRWSIDPQTHKRVFDHNAAAAAANLYLQLGSHPDRCIVLLEALREVKVGEEHVAICTQLSELYAKVGKGAKENELLDEALRYLDELCTQATGEQRVNLCMQYAEIAEKRGKTEEAKAHFQAALDVVEKESQAGNPLAAVIVDLIRGRMAGEPMPTQEELNARQEAALKAHLEARQAESRERSDSISYSVPASSVASSNPELLANYIITKD